MEAIHSLLDWLGPFYVGLLFLTGLVAIPLCLLLLLLNISKKQRTKRKKEEVETQKKAKSEAEVEAEEEAAEIIYSVDGCNVILHLIENRWKASVQVGDHRSKLDIPPQENAGKALWEAVNYLRIPREQSVFN